ncbi:hypothetical protein RRG08_041469 [Elysia crispata]|uniref:Uncharacterized protein n=1 Tax=Elysia crispata TaxID=231223 RepID=A0AAE1CRG6_9GAST|nr:hypothetical protein RRG08_041469 [Elysia crispata]
MSGMVTGLVSTCGCGIVVRCATNKRHAPTCSSRPDHTARGGRPPEQGGQPGAALSLSFYSLASCEVASVTGQAPAAPGLRGVKCTGM